MSETVPELFAVWAKKRKLSTKVINAILDGFASHNYSPDEEAHCIPSGMTWIQYLSSRVTVGDILETDIEDIRKYPGLGNKGLEDLISAVKMPAPKTVTLGDYASEKPFTKNL